MKARVKAKQVEVMTDSLKQVIEVNKEYHRQILNLKKQIQDRDIKYKQLQERSATVATDNIKLLNDIQQLEETNYGHSKVTDSLMKNMPMERDNGDLVYKGILYRKKSKGFIGWFRYFGGK
ncbi:MAG: hypothetical protein IJX07_06185 [Bacillales bacterium]|nr:hypothetical protein [Bacillales bacterium]